MRTLAFLLAAAPALAQQASNATRSSSPSAVPSSAVAAFTIDDALNVTTYQAGDLSRDGRWLFATSSVRRDNIGIDYNRSYGDPTYIAPAPRTLWLFDLQSGQSRQILPAKHTLLASAWSDDARRLALLVERSGRPSLEVWERESGRLTPVAVPRGQYVAENSPLRWTKSGELTFALRTDRWRDSARAEFLRLTIGPVIVQGGEEQFLAWDALRGRGFQRSIAAYDPSSRRLRELVAERMVGNWTFADDGSVVALYEDVTKKTDYDVIFGRENRLRAVIPGSEATGDLRLADTGRIILPTLKGINLVWSRDGKRFAYAQEGRLYMGSVADTARRQIAGDTARRAAPDTSREGRERAADERFTPVRWTPDGSALAASNRRGIWLIDVATRARELVIETSDSLPESPRANTIGFSPDGRYLYMTANARRMWQRGISRYDRQTKRLDELVKDDRLYSSITIAEQGSTIVFAAAAGNRPPDLYAAGLSLENPRRLTNANPWLDAKLGRTELMTYLDADGHEKFGVVHYPRGYQKGTRYPTVFIIYEQFFDDTFDPVANMLNSRGYLVVKPSVDFETGYPGEAWVKGVTSAANQLIERGIADSARLGVHGTSYGGYATNLLITQTPRFKAAINISGKVDLISFTWDSPRLGVRNVHAAEKSQDRIGATFWQAPQKYIAHSAVFFADRIRTPLLLLTGEQDHNVPAINTREMYYALRRLGKEVVWVHYMGGGHGVPMNSLSDFTDFHNRILGWYDEKLKKHGAAAKAVTTNASQPGSP